MSNSRKTNNIVVVGPPTPFNSPEEGHFGHFSFKMKEGFERVTGACRPFSFCKNQIIGVNPKSISVVLQKGASLVMMFG